MTNPLRPQLWEMPKLDRNEMRAGFQPNRPTDPNGLDDRHTEMLRKTENINNTQRNATNHTLFVYAPYGHGHMYAAAGRSTQHNGST